MISKERDDEGRSKEGDVVELNTALPLGASKR